MASRVGGVVACVAGLLSAAAQGSGSNCSAVKQYYQEQQCCGQPGKALSGAAPAWACASSAPGVCDCERMRNALAGVPGAMFPAELCAHMAHLRPVGSRSEPICEAGDALGRAEWLRDGFAGNTAFPHGLLKVLATVGEVDPLSGSMLTGAPDGQGAYLRDAETLRFVYQSESYGPITRQESLPYFVNGAAQVSLTGSHIHYIDFDRDMLSRFMEPGAPSNALSMIKGSGEAIQRMYNLARQPVGPRNRAGNSTSPHHSNVDVHGQYIVVASRTDRLAPPTKADWVMQSLCSAHLAPRHQWGGGMGVEDNLFITNEEWIAYKTDTTSMVGLPVHVLDLATHELWATSAFGLGGHEKIVEVNSGTTDFVAFVPSGYNGAFGGPFPHILSARNAQYNRTDGNPYVWPQNIVPTRLFLGKKNTDKDGAANTTDFLARNGFEYGAVYGFATDCSAGTPGAAGRDAWHRSTATPGATVQGAFYRLRWQDAPGRVQSFEHDGAWEFQDAPQGAPAGWCFWNAAGSDAAGAKTEHVSPDPRGGQRVLQGSTAGYLGVYDFPALPQALSGGAFPQSVPANYTCLQPESDVRALIELGGQGHRAGRLMRAAVRAAGKRLLQRVHGRRVAAL